MSDGTILAAPGRYRLEVQRDGFVAAERAIELRAGATTGVAVALEERPSILTSWWLWLGVGAAAAGAAVASILLLSHSRGVKAPTEIDQCPARGC
jgi:hypothetical protein